MPGFKRKRGRWGNARRSVKRRLTFRAFRTRRRTLQRYKRTRRWKSKFIKSIVPRVTFMKHRYESTFTMTPSATVIVYHASNANSMYDPNQSGAGHQPYGRDTMAQLYGVYEVLFCEITSRVFSLAASTAPLLVGQLAKNDTQALPTVGDLTLWKESPACNYKVLRPTAKDNEHVVTLKKKIRCRKWCPDKDQNNGTVGANPAQLVQHVLWCHHIDASTSGAHRCQVSMVFWTMWTQPVLTLASS